MLIFLCNCFVFIHILCIIALLIKNIYIMVSRFLYFVFVLFLGLSYSQTKKSCGKKKNSFNDVFNIAKKCSTSKKGTKRMLIRRKKSKKNHMRKNTSNAGLSTTIEKMPFNLVDRKPVFSNCVGIEESKQSKCFKNELLRHVKRHFNYPEDSYERGIQGKVLVQFVIDEFGEVDNIWVRGPKNGKELEKEAKRIVKRLPKFVFPGKKGNNVVKVKYGFPINFRIE